MATRCYVVDIDGTIANIEHRLHYIKEGFGEAGELLHKPDWDAFLKACVNDKPIPHMRTLLDMLDCARSYGPRHGYVAFIYVTGRNERSRDDTMSWLEWNFFPNPDKLYMRKDNDFRPDHVIKKEILDQMRADGYEPILAIDDRTQVVKMWRANGIPCLQCAEGNY